MQEFINIYVTFRLMVMIIMSIENIVKHNTEIFLYEFINTSENNGPTCRSIRGLMGPRSASPRPISRLPGMGRRPGLSEEGASLWSGGW